MFFKVWIKSIVNWVYSDLGPKKKLHFLTKDKLTSINNAENLILKSF